MAQVKCLELGFGQSEIKSIFIAKFLKQILLIYLFLERGERREKGRETSVCERNIDPFARPQPGIWPTTQTCALLRIGQVTVQFVEQCPTL